MRGRGDFSLHLSLSALFANPFPFFALRWMEIRKKCNLSYFFSFFFFFFLPLFHFFALPKRGVKEYITLFGVICLECLTEIALPTVGCLVDYARAANCFRRPCAAASCSTFEPNMEIATPSSTLFTLDLTLI